MESNEILLVFSDENSSENMQKEIWVTKFAHFLERTVFKIFQQSIKVNSINIEKSNIKKSKIVLLILDTDLLQSEKASDIVRRITENNTQNPENEGEFETPLLIVYQQDEMLPANYSLNHQRVVDFSDINITEYLPNVGRHKVSPKKENLFWLKMYDLAALIKKENKLFSQGLDNADRSRTIYLAKVTSDLEYLRDDIKRDLKRHGYNVIPNSNAVDTDADNIEDEIKKQLQGASMSLHLVGEEYGEVIRESKSITDLQNKVADEHGAAMNSNSTTDRFYRTIWLAPQLDEISEATETFINDVNRDIEAKEESEFLRVPFDELKAIIRDKLKVILADKDIPTVINNQTNSNIYLIYDRKDFTVSEDLRKALEAKGFDVSIPEFDGEIFELEPKHLARLKVCDACLVLVDKANETWLNTKLKDIDKVLGLGRNRRMETKGVLFFNELPINTHINNGTIVMKNEGTSLNKILEPFIQKIEK